MTHTSGVPTYTGGSIRHPDRMGATPRELLAVVTDKPLQFPHGRKLAYNNTGFVLLGMLIEKVSGKTYPEFVHSRLFVPQRMRDSGFDDARRVLPHRASGYRLIGDALENAEYVDASVAWSAGRFYSTVRDLIAWGTALLGGSILQKTSTDQMFRIYPETLLQGMHYGYGTS